MLADSLFPKPVRVGRRLLRWREEDFFSWKVSASASKVTAIVRESIDYLIEELGGTSIVGARLGITARRLKTIRETRSATDSEATKISALLEKVRAEKPVTIFNLEA